MTKSNSDELGWLRLALHQRKMEVLRGRDWNYLVDYISLLEAGHQRSWFSKIQNALGMSRAGSIFDCVPTFESRYYVEDQPGNRTFALKDCVFESCVEFDYVLRLQPHETRAILFVTKDGPKKLEVMRIE